MRDRGKRDLLTVFNEALEIPQPKDRAAYLEEACAGDQVLRDRVQTLLRAHDDAEGFLEQDDNARGGGVGTEQESDSDVLRNFGDYEILEELARGGMGVVYRARQVSLNRIVAVKLILQGQAASEGAVQRFQRETEAVGRLDHPNIIPIHEVGEHGGERFFSMKFVEGGRSLVGWKGTKRQAASIVALIANAVNHAHQRGILHRDLKPSNVLLDNENVPYLTDFGLAKLTEEASSGLTRSLDVMGTPNYMPPEQASGKSAEATIAADVYGVGAILYELLCGKPPFAGDSGIDVLRRVVDEEVRSISSVVPGIDRDLETICLKCLEKQPSHRYGTTAEVADELDRWSDHQPILARPVSTVARIRKWVVRRPAYAALIALGCLSLLVIGAGTVMFSLRLSQEAEETTRQLIHSHESMADHDEDRGDTFGAVLRLTEALRLEEEVIGDHGTRLRLRIASMLNNNPSLRNMWFHPDAVDFVKHSPGGKMLVTCGNDGSVKFYDGGSGKALEGGIQCQGAVLYAAFSDDGRFIATASQEGLAEGQGQVWDVARREAVSPSFPVLFQKHKRPMHPPVDFGRGGCQIVTCHTNGITHWRLQKGIWKPIELYRGDDAICCALSPDGLWVAAGTGGHGCQIWNSSTGERLQTPLTNSRVTGVSFQHDGKRLAILDDSIRSIIVYTFDEFGAPLGDPVIAHHPERNVLRQCTFDAQGQHIVGTSFSDVVLWDAGTGKLVSPPMPHGVVLMAQFSRDGQRVVSTALDGSVLLWNVSSGELWRPLLPHGAAVFYAEFDPGGHHLVTASQDGVARRWDLGSGPDGTQIRLPLEATEKEAKTMVTSMLSPSNELLLTGVEGGEVSLWSTADWTRTLPVITHEEPNVRGAFSPDGRRFAIAESNSTTAVFSRIHIRNVATGAESGPPMEIDAFANEIQFGPDGNLLTISGWSLAGSGGFAGVWEIATGNLVTPWIKHPSIVTDSRISPDGKYLATVSDDRFIRIFDLPSGRLVKKSAALSGRPRTVRWHPSEHQVLTACNSSNSYAPEAARLWNPLTDVEQLLHHRDGVIAAVFDPQGLRIATGGEGKTVRLWDAANGEPTVAPIGPVNRVYVVAFSADGTLVAAGNLGEAHVWDAATGQRIVRIELEGTVKQLGFGPNNQQLIVASSRPASVTVVPLPTINTPVNELQRNAQLLSGHRLDPDLGLVPLEATALRHIWSEYTEK